MGKGEFNAMGKAELMKSRQVINIMEVCGSHTEVIFKYGLRKLYEGRVKFISGPGCPVCVTPAEEIDEVIKYAKSNFVITTFGDLLRVPGTNSSLSREKSLGAHIKSVYSPLEALKYARDNPEKPVIFVGIGFETTAPLIALTIKKAKEAKVTNFSVLSLHKTMPGILKSLLQDCNFVDGLLLPGHVCAVIGSNPFKFIAEQYKIMGVISGFTPEDVVESIETILKNHHNPIIDIQYLRAVTACGNKISQQVMEEVFEPQDSCWRGFGTVKNSGLAIKKEWSFFDARKRYGLSPKPSDGAIEENCSCSEVIRGRLTPIGCLLFKKACSPENPKGPCMASSEGTCSIYYKFGG